MKIVGGKKVYWSPSKGHHAEPAKTLEEEQPLPKPTGADQQAVRKIRIDDLAASSIEEARRILSDEWEGEAPKMGEVPPIIVRKTPSGRYAIMDGFHRVAAALGRGDSSVMGVVATADEIANEADLSEGNDAAQKWIDSVLSARRPIEKGWGATDLVKGGSQRRPPGSGWLPPSGKRKVTWKERGYIPSKLALWLTKSNIGNDHDLSCAEQARSGGL